MKFLFNIVGDLTQKGFDLRHQSLWTEFLKSLDGAKPVKTLNETDVKVNSSLNTNYTHQSRSLKTFYLGKEGDHGFLPWERQHVFEEMEKAEVRDLNFKKEEFLHGKVMCLILEHAINDFHTFKLPIIFTAFYITISKKNAFHPCYDSGNYSAGSICNHPKFNKMCDLFL